MRSNRWVLVGVYVASAAVLIAGIAVLVRSRDDGQTATAAPSSLAPMPFPTTLTLATPPRGSVGTQFTVVATSFSTSPLATVDLYDGDRRVASGAPAPGSASVVLTHPALSVGPHALHARLTDAEGETALTPATVVQVGVALPREGIVKVDDDGAPVAPSGDGASEPPAETVDVPVVPEPDETGSQLAGRLDVDVAALVGVADPARALPAGVPVVVRVPGDAGIDALEGDEVVVSSPGSGDDDVPLEASGDGCEVVLRTDDEDATVFDGAGGPTGWSTVQGSGSGSELRLRDLSPGPHVFVARTGELTSTPVSVLVPLRCSTASGWEGDAKILDGTLYLPPAATGPVYLYLQIDGGTGVRVPASIGVGNAFGAGTTTDVSALIPNLGPEARSVELEVWRSSEFPTQVASGRLTVPDGQTANDIIGTPGIITLTVQQLPGKVLTSLTSDLTLEYRDEALTFDWTAASDDVDEVLWQVFASAPPAGQNVLAAPSVLAAGISDASAAQGGVGTQGTFTFDTASIPGHDATAPDLGTGAGALTPVTQAITPAQITTLTKPRITSISDASAATAFVPLPGPGENVFVRVTPNPKSAAPGPPSNRLAIRLPFPAPPESATTGGVSLTVDEMTLDPGRTPSPDFAGCAQVTLPNKYGDSLKDERNAAHRVYTQGSGIYCYVPPAADDGCDLDVIPVVGAAACEAADLAVALVDELVAVLKGAYGAVSTLYNGAVQLAVKAVSTFNPVCIALGQADDGAGEACKGTTALAAQLAITSVLASVGLPPALPSVAELEAIAQGKLDQLAVALMQQAGIPCDSLKASPAVAEAVGEAGSAIGASEAAAAAADPCTALASRMVSAAKKSVLSTVSQRVAQATGLPDFSYLSGFSMTPAPQGLPEPMQVQVTAHATNPGADITGLVCSVWLVPTSNGQTPLPFDGPSTLRFRPDDPSNPASPFRGSAVVSNYFAGTGDFVASLRDLDITMSFSMAPRLDAEGRLFVDSLGRLGSGCKDGKATVTERVRPFGS